MHSKHTPADKCLLSPSSQHKAQNNSLRILMVSNLPKLRELGAAKIQIELAEALREGGHTVREFYADDGFPRTYPKLLTPLLRTKRDFVSAAHRFIYKHRYEFDVIDAMEGSVAKPSADLEFEGLLTVRSAGLTGLYSEILSKAFPPCRKFSARTILGNAWRNIGYRRDRGIEKKSFEVAHLANLVNDEEEQFFREKWQLNTPIVKLPYGISSKRLTAFKAAAASSEERLRLQRVVLVGMWQPRKGSQDVARIFRQVRTEQPKARFLLLGTGESEERIHAELDHEFDDCLEVVPSYQSESLPLLLSAATVGIFPSYVESFGFAVLEKLASGLPTVSYRCPGPPVMLQHCDPSCLVAVGDTETIARQVIHRLRMTIEDFDEQSKQSFRIAALFDWSNIAVNTSNEFRNAYTNLRASKSLGR